MKRLVGTTVALNVGDRGTFQYFVFVSEQEVLGRKSAIVFASPCIVFCSSLHARNGRNQFPLGRTSSSSALFSSDNSLVIWSGLSRRAVTYGAIAWTLSNCKLDYKRDNYFFQISVNCEKVDSIWNCLVPYLSLLAWIITNLFSKIEVILGEQKIVWKIFKFCKNPSFSVKQLLIFS